MTEDRTNDPDYPTDDELPDDIPNIADLDVFHEDPDEYDTLAEFVRAEAAATEK